MTSSRAFSIGPVHVGDGSLVIIGGPCVIENREMALETAEFLAKVCRSFNVGYIFKASYLKANRTSVDSYTGPGLHDGLAILDEISRSVGCPLLTDIHETTEVDTVSEVVDILQIPAFLCRQTSLLLKAGSSGKAVNIKKGQFLAPQDMKHAVEKVVRGGGTHISVTERGTFFGYGDLVVDMRSFTMMRSFGYPVLFDATHSTQRPGGLGTVTGGNRDLSGPLSRAAVAYGIDGLYMEVHPCPSEAFSDAACQLDYGMAKRVIADAVRIHDLVSESR